MCKVFGINRSTYYKFINHISSNRDEENKRFDEDILTIYYDTKNRYRTQKIHLELLYIYSIVIKKYRHFSSNKPIIEKENILKQDFTTIGINQKWCTDITYIHTQKDGWTYLESVMDFYSRKIIGWSYGITMSVELATKAVENACLNVTDTIGIILQSDLGTQYTSELFEKSIAKKKIYHSFSRKG